MDDHRRSTEIVHWPISSLDGGAAVDRNKYRARLRSMSKTMDNPVDATRSAVEHASDNRFHRVTPTSTRRHSIITETGRFWNRAASIRAAKISVQHISSRVLYEQLGQLWRVPTSNYNCAIIGRGGRGEGRVDVRGMMGKFPREWTILTSAVGTWLWIFSMMEEGVNDSTFDESFFALLKNLIERIREDKYG